MNLPQDIHLETFSYLPAEDLFKCSRVSKSWKALIYSSSLWKAEFYRRKEITSIPSFVTEIEKQNQWKTFFSLLIILWKAKKFFKFESGNTISTFYSRCKTFTKNLHS